MIGLPHYLTLAAVLFTIGAIGVVVRRNALTILMSIELMLNAANLTFVAFSRFPLNLKVTSARGSYVAKAMVTHRIKPMMIDGKKTYQIGIPIHWGYRGIAEDAGRTDLHPVNVLSPAVVDPNAYTPEFKGFLVKVEKV